MYKISISGNTLQLDDQFITGSVLRRYLMRLADVRDSPVTPGQPYKYHPRTNNPHGRLWNSGDIIDLAHDETDFVLAPVRTL